MKIERIIYQKIFPLAPYVNERIGVEVKIEEGESPEDALLEAKKFVGKFGNDAENKIEQAIDAEFQKIKSTLLGMAPMAAKCYLATTPYRLHPELNHIVKILLENGKE